MGSPARASLRNASGAQDQERAERTVLSAAEHTLPEEECDVICYSPPQGSITHAGPLAQGRQHLGSEEQKPGDAAGCVTLPRSGYTSVRQHRWLPVCVPSLRAGASLRWELPGDPLSCAHPMFSLLPDSKAQHLQDHHNPSLEDANCPQQSTSTPSLLPPETRLAPQMGAKCIEAPTLGMPRGLKKTAAPRSPPWPEAGRPPKDTLGATGCELCAGRSADGHPNTLLGEDGI